MTYMEEVRAWQSIMDRGYPYPWYFDTSSESEFAGKDYHKYWAYVESGKKEWSASEAYLEVCWHREGGV